MCKEPVAPSQSLESVTMLVSRVARHGLLSCGRLSTASLGRWGAEMSSEETSARQGCSEQVCFDPSNPESTLHTRNKQWGQNMRASHTSWKCRGYSSCLTHHLTLTAKLGLQCYDYETLCPLGCVIIEFKHEGKVRVQLPCRYNQKPSFRIWW